MAAAPQSTSLTQLRDAAPQRIDTMPAVRSGFENLQGFELMQRAAKAFSQSTLVPKDYQGNLPNCMIALEMAQRIGASPLMVAQHLYIVHGRPAWSAVFMIASFNQCGRFGAIRYEWSGKEGTDERGCRAYAIEKATGEKIQGPLITIALAKKEGWYGKSGSKWQTMPELMTMYRAASWLVRSHAPEISMGLQTTEEVHDTFDATVDASGGYVVTQESLRAAAPEPEAEGNVPYFSAETALAAIAETATAPDLAKLWPEIALAFQQSNREMPVEVEAAYNDRFEALQQKAGKKG